MNPAKAGNRFLGAMAQDIEKDPYGKQIVNDTPAGKVLDMKPLVSALLAGAGRLHQRSDAHEGALADMRGLLHVQGLHIRGLKQKVDEHAQMMGSIRKILAEKPRGV